MSNPSRIDGGSTPSNIVVRPAVIEDAPVLVKLVRSLADYELAPGQVQLQVRDLEAALFGPGAKVFAHVAEINGVIVGAAIWFLNFSTWTGRHGVYLEDLFVVPQARGHGAGRALLTELARMAMARGYTRVEWAVLDWNESAVGFYRHLGAQAQDEWTVFRLSGAALADLVKVGDSLTPNPMYPGTLPASLLSRSGQPFTAMAQGAAAESPGRSELGEGFPSECQLPRRR